MNYLFESRSKDNYDEYTDSDGYTYTTAPPMPWHELPQFLFYLLLFPFAIGIYGLCAALYGFYHIAKKTSADGEPEFPTLVMVGILVSALLYMATSSHLLDLADHPFITFWSVILIFFFTLPPLTGLCLRFFNLLFSALFKRS